MSVLIKSMIAGGKTAAGEQTITAPYDLAPIARIETTAAEGVMQALDTAYQLFRDRTTWLPVTQRIEILERAASLMQARAETLAVVAAQEGGKPLIDSRVEVARAIDSIHLCVRCLRSGAGEVVPMGVDAASSGRLAFTLHEPIGVVVAVSAFNHPLNLIAHQGGPAIAAGCPVIVKPAGDTPLSCFRLVEILREAGLPEAWCQALVTTDQTVTGQLVTDPRVAFLSFIGSAKVGWMLRSTLAPGTRCALEHGGVAPVIVAEDANISVVIPQLLKGGFYHAGQVCVSVQRVFVHRSLARDVAQQLAAGADKLVIGDPTREETEVGPLIRPAEVERIHEWVTAAVAEGAELLTGGKKDSETTYQCTVLFDPAADSKVSTQEIFGPVICVYPYDSMDEAIQRANSLPYAFQAAVFSTDMDRVIRASRRLDAATVMVNDHTAFRVDWMPFAGLRESGLGTGGVPYTFRDMQIEKLVVIHSDELS